MTRSAWMWLAAILLASSALVRAADENLRIVPIVSKDDVVVSFEGADTYTDEVRAAISSGLRTTFTYEVELRMLVPAWVDRTIASSVVSVTDQYDNLTRRHTLSRMIDGRVEQASVTEDEAVVKQWLTIVQPAAAHPDVEAGPEPRLLRQGSRSCPPAWRVAARMDDRHQRADQVHLRPLRTFRLSCRRLRVVTRLAAGRHARLSMPAVPRDSDRSPPCTRCRESSSRARSR